MIRVKTCTKCNKSKLIDEFHNDKTKKDGKYPSCKECNNERNKKYYYQHHEERIEKNLNHYYQHRKERSEESKEWYEKTGRQKLGHKSMYEDKTTPQYLGIVIGERLCRHLFKDVEVMPYGFPGYDFICSRNKKINVKTSCIRLTPIKNKYWGFDIEYNKIADFFICVAFDNRTDLNPLHLWMIPGKEINHLSGLTISLSTIHKWDKWERDINDAQLCCAEMKSKEIQ